MEEGETKTILLRKELRKQRLMEYLIAKGKLKQPNPNPNLHDKCQVKKSVISVPKVVTGKENKATADRFSCERKKVPNFATQSNTHTTRRVFGINNTLNVKGRVQSVQKKTNCLSTTSGPAKPKLNQNPLPTKRYTVVSSKSNLNIIGTVKKQSNTGIKPSDRPSSYAAPTSVSKSNSRFSSSSNAVWKCPVKTIGVRMSLGTIIKTKTGLLSAVTQPRNNQSQTGTQSSSAATGATTTSSNANKARSRTSSLVSVSKRSVVHQGKTLPITALKKNVNDRKTVYFTAKAGDKIQDQSKSKSEPVLDRRSLPSFKAQVSSGLKATYKSKSIAAPNKPEGEVEMSETSKSGGHTTDGSIKQKSKCDQMKKGQQSKFVPQLSSGLASKCSSKSVSGVTQANTGELAGKNMTRTTGKETHKRGDVRSAIAPKPQTGIKRTMVSQTVPQPARTIRYTSQKTDVKKTKIPVRIIPQTEGKKLTADQEERMRKLKEWREAKGISYKRPPMPVKPQVRCTVAVPQPFWAVMKDEDEANSLITTVDISLADCIKLLGEGCSPDQVRAVLSRLPAVSQKFAKYWICQARLMEQEGNLDVLPMFEEAVRIVLEPVDELRAVVFEILKKKDEIQGSDKNEEDYEVTSSESFPEYTNGPMMTPKPVRVLICGEKGNSSVVKYKITATPGGLQSQRKEHAIVNGQELRFFTPVRRSVRINRASLQYPASLQEHDVCVESYNDLISEEDGDIKEEQERVGSSPPSNTPMYIYRENEALQDKVIVQLIYDDTDSL